MATPDTDLDPLARFRLDGKVAIVTGASSGLGTRFARVLDAAGARVVLVARRGERLEQLASELQNDALPVPQDLSDLDRVGSVIERALERHGRVDVLVNNAGTVDVHPAEEEPLEEFRRVIDVNLVAPFALAQHAARAMLGDGQDGGTIVNVASVLGLVGVGQIPQAGYAASKGGLVNLTRELSAQWSRKGIRVNAIAPGWFESEMTADMFSEEGRGRDWVARRAPLARHGREGELDGALLYLSSDASSYVTGHVLAVDGGWTAI
ncbi:MAG: glucose 1-dehydrogenase [Solirubrobacterales bacterium]|nr:glucose 1-dehydrogenase [Solirubrobacterales bacterium]MBV9807161.1 glucose 1-dehydrogenase [Solirubrobacterales bacterium]